jgi:uncharacterized protein VirK/YbjX
MAPTKQTHPKKIMMLVICLVAERSSFEDLLGVSVELMMIFVS